jgi:hypothetical protein
MIADPLDWHWPTRKNSRSSDQESIEAGVGVAAICGIGHARS